MTCPDCGGVDSAVVNTSHDPEGHKIRRRRCETCGMDFNTVEVAFPFSFHEADEGKRQSQAYSSRIKVPEYEPSWFEMERVRPSRAVRRRGPNGRLMLPARQLIPDPEGTAILVTLRRSSKYPRCRKGLHVLKGANVYQAPRGNRVCNACRRNSANERYRAGRAA